ncbi:MAG: extracellular solute-binding protein [Nocardioidaceae bacterium]|nr:extracellular solute-binding protein [Nocardioidaceae bacterium]
MALAVGGALVASLALAACGGGGSADGATSLTWYINPDVGNLDPSKGGQAALAQRCSQESGGAYDIDVELLPNDASQQREQLVRRLAAGDDSIDLMSLDPAFTGEFANAKFLAPIPQGDQTRFTEGVLKGALDSATFEDQLVAVPLWSNTQILWYRKSVAERAGLDMSNPVTWKQVIDAAAETDTTVQVQARRYEGYAVWLNALITSAGGSIVSDVEAGQDAKIGVDSKAGRDAATVVQELVDSGAANPGLPNADETQSIAGFTADDGAFMVNWEYVYTDPSTEAIRDDIGWAKYPEVVEGEASRPPLGGINMAVSAFSQHPDESYAAVECLTSPESQKAYALNSGNQPALEEVYSDPELVSAYPMADLWRQSIEDAAPRPLTPYWTDISAALVSSWHSPRTVDPATTPERSQKYIEDVLKGRALL